MKNHWKVTFHWPLPVFKLPNLLASYMANYVLQDQFHLLSDMINVLLSSERTTKTSAKNTNASSKYNLNNTLLTGL